MRNAVQRRLDSEYFAAYGRLDPIEVARLISSVVTAKQPKARYLGGFDARAIDILEAASDGGQPALVELPGNLFA